MASSSWRKRQLDKLATLVECSRVSSRQAGLLTAWVADMIRESCGDTAPGAVAATSEAAYRRVDACLLGQAPVTFFEHEVAGLVVGLNEVVHVRPQV
ncbi:hypothetical protein MTO96_027092 [Rhipicephalus appendiculatus]